MTKSFSTREAVRQAGLSYRRADYWVRTGAVAPTGQAASGSGSRRRWAVLDVHRLTAIADVATALAGFGVTALPVELVGELWRRLRLEPETIIAHGCVQLVITLPEPT